MFVQPTITPNYHNNYVSYRQNKNVNFNGQLGQTLLKELSTAGTKESADINKILKKLGIGAMGVVSLASLKDILEAIVEKNSELDSKIKSIRKTKKQLSDNFNAQEAYFQNRYLAKDKEQAAAKKAIAEEKEAFAEEKKAAKEELESQIANEKKAAEDYIASKKQDYENYVKDKEQEFYEKEKSIGKSQCAVNEQEKNRIISSTRVLYGLKDKNIKSYDSLAEQIKAVTSLLKTKKNRVKDIDPSVVESVAKVMQNDDGVIQDEMMKFAKKVFSSGKDIYMNDFSRIVSIVKDNTGNLDIEKAAIITTKLSSGSKNNSVKSIIDDIYNLTDTKNVVVDKKDADKYNELKTKLEEVTKEKDNLEQGIIEENKSYKAKFERLRSKCVSAHPNLYESEEYHQLLSSLVEMYQDYLTKLGIYDQIMDLKTEIAKLNQADKNNPLHISNLLSEKDFDKYLRLTYSLENAKEIRKTVKSNLDNIIDICNWRIKHYSPNKEHCKRYEERINDTKKLFNPTIAKLDIDISDMEAKISMLKAKTAGGNEFVISPEKNVAVRASEQEGCDDGILLAGLALLGAVLAGGSSSCSSGSCGCSYDFFGSGSSSSGSSGGSSEESHLQEKKSELARIRGVYGSLPDEDDFSRHGISLNSAEKSELRGLWTEKRANDKGWESRVHKGPSSCDAMWW